MADVRSENVPGTPLTGLTGTVRDPDRFASWERPRKALKLLRLMRTPSYRTALRHGVAAAVEHERLPYLRDAATVVDVGAHQGQFAAFALEWFPEAAIVCVEPLEVPRRRLMNAVGNSDRVRVLDVAASNRGEERVRINVSRHDDSSSLQPIGPRQIAAFPGTEEAGHAWIRTARLDALLTSADLSAPALLKVDVQGHEYEALEGAGDLLGSFRQVVVEVSFTELYLGQKLAGAVVALLTDAGLELTGVFDVKRTRAGGCLQADFMFERWSDLGLDQPDPGGRAPGS